LYRSISVFAFENILEAVKVVPLIIDLSPSALELLDSTVLNYNNLLSNQKQINLNNSKQGTILFIEFDGNSRAVVELRSTLCIQKIKQYGEILQTAYDRLSVDKIWAARKSALTNVMKLTVGSRKPLTLIEDTVVNPKYLHDYTHFLLEVYRKYKLDHVFYGHAGNGNLHTRPIMDNSLHYNDLVKSVADEVFSKVYHYSGSITAEHGDGIGRTKYISQMYGKVLFEIFKKIKFIFDPTNIMNPGKKVIP
jgi:FAD/FMN-containing dehydrogenase